MHLVFAAQAMHAKLNIPLEGLRLSKNAALLASKEPHQFNDMARDAATLKSLAIGHGEMIFVLYQ